MNSKMNVNFSKDEANQKGKEVNCVQAYALY
jgi:hypothetical protein